VNRYSVDVLPEILAFEVLRTFQKEEETERSLLVECDLPRIGDDLGIFFGRDDYTN
jgi:hypothetical protein